MAQVTEQLTDWLYLTDDPSSRADNMDSTCGDDCFSDDRDKWYLIQFQLCTLGFSFAFSITMIGCRKMCVIHRNLRTSPLSRQRLTSGRYVSRPQRCKSKPQSCKLFSFLRPLHLITRIWMPASAKLCVLYLKYARDVFCRNFAAIHSTRSIAKRNLKLIPSLRRQNPTTAELRRGPVPTARLVSKVPSQPSKTAPDGASEISFSQTTFECCSFWDSALQALHSQDWQKIRTCTSAYLYGSVQPNQETTSDYGADQMKTGCEGWLLSNSTGYLGNKDYTEVFQGEKKELQGSTREHSLGMNKVSKEKTAHPLVALVSNSPYTPPVRFINIGKTQDVVMTAHSLAAKEDSKDKMQGTRVYQPGNLPKRIQADGAGVGSATITTSPNVEDAMSDLLSGDMSLIVNKYSFTKEPSENVQAMSQASKLQDSQSTSSQHCPGKCQLEEDRRFSRRLQGWVNQKDMNAPSETSDKKEANAKRTDRLKMTCKQNNGETTQTRRSLGQPSGKPNGTITKASNVVDPKLPEKDGVESKLKTELTEDVTSSDHVSHSRGDSLSKATDHQGKNKKLILETTKQQQLQPGTVKKTERKCSRIATLSDKTRPNQRNTSEVSESTMSAEASGPEPAGDELNNKAAIGKPRCRLLLNKRRNPGTPGLHEIPQTIPQIAKNIPKITETAAEHLQNKYREYWKLKPWCRKADRRHQKLKEVDAASQDVSDRQQRELVHLTTDLSTYMQKTLEVLKCFYKRVDQGPKEWKGPFPRKSFSEKFCPYNIAYRSHSHVGRCLDERLCLTKPMMLETNTKGEDCGQLAFVTTEKHPPSDVCGYCSVSKTTATSQGCVHGQFDPGTSYKTCDTVAFLDFFLHLPSFFQQQQHSQVKGLSKTGKAKKYLGSSPEEVSGAVVNEIQQAKLVANPVVDQIKKLPACTEPIDISSCGSVTASEFDAKNSAQESMNKSGKMDTSNAEDCLPREGGFEEYLNKCLQEEFKRNSRLCKKSSQENQNATSYPWSKQQLAHDTTFLKVDHGYCSGQRKVENSRSSMNSSTISTLHQVTSFTEQLHSNKLNKTDTSNGQIHDLRESLVIKANRSQLLPACPMGRTPGKYLHRSKIPLPVNCRREPKRQKLNTEESRPGRQVGLLFPNNKGQRSIGIHIDREELSRVSRMGHIHQKVPSIEETSMSKIKGKTKYQVMTTSLPKVGQTEQTMATNERNKRRCKSHRRMITSPMKIFDGKTRADGHSYGNIRCPCREITAASSKYEVDTRMFRSRTSAPKFINKPPQTHANFVRNEKTPDHFSRRRRGTTSKFNHGYIRKNCFGDPRLLTQRATWPPNYESSDSFSMHVPPTHKPLLSSIQKTNTTGGQVDNRATNVFQDGRETREVPTVAQYIEAQWLHTASEEALLVSLDELDRRLEGIHPQMTASTSGTYVKEMAPGKTAKQDHSSEENVRVSQEFTPRLKNSKFKNGSFNEAVNASRTVVESRIRAIKGIDTRAPRAGGCELEAPQTKSGSGKQKPTGTSGRQLPTSFTKRSQSEHRPSMNRAGVRTFYHICDRVTQPGQRPRSKSSEADVKDESFTQIKDTTLSTPLAKIVIAAIDRHSRCLSPNRWRHSVGLQKSMKHSHSICWPRRQHGANSKLPSYSSLAHYPHMLAKRHSQSRKFDKAKTAQQIQQWPEGTLAKETRQARDTHDCVSGRTTELSGGKISTNAQPRRAGEGMLAKAFDKEGAPSLIHDAVKTSWLPVQSGANDIPANTFRHSCEHEQSRTKTNDTDEELHMKNSTMKANSRSGVPISKLQGKLQGKIPRTNTDKLVYRRDNSKNSGTLIMSLNKTNPPHLRPYSQQFNRREKVSEKESTPQRPPSLARTDEDKTESMSKIAKVAAHISGQANSSRTRNKSLCLKSHQRDCVQSSSSLENASSHMQRSVGSNSTANVACSASRIEITSPTDQFTEVECPDEKHCRRTKLVRAVPEDLLISLWSRKAHAVSNDRTKKIQTLGSKVSSKENDAKDRRQDVQPLPLPTNGSRDMGQFVVAGNLSAIKCGAREIRKLPEKVQGVYGKSQDCIRLRKSVENIVAWDEDGQSGSVTDSVQRCEQDTGIADAVHDSRANNQKYVQSTDSAVSTATKGKAKEKCLKQGSKSDHCWKRPSCEHSSSPDRHLNGSIGPEVLATTSVPFLADKDAQMRNSQTLPHGRTEQFSLHEQTGHGLWSFEPRREQQAPRKRLENVSRPGALAPTCAAGRCLRSKRESSTGRVSAEVIRPERYHTNPNTFRTYPSKHTEAANMEHREDTDKPQPFHRRAGVGSEGAGCQSTHPIPPGIHTNWNKCISGILEDPACLAHLEQGGVGINKQPLNGNVTDSSHLVRQGLRVENGSLSQGHDCSSQGHDGSRQGHTFATDLPRMVQTNVSGKKNASDHLQETCLHRMVKDTSPRPYGQRNRRLANGSTGGLVVSSRRSSPDEIKSQSPEDQLCFFSRWPPRTVKGSRGEQQTQAFTGNVNKMNTREVTNSNKESKIPDGGHNKLGAVVCNTTDKTEVKARNLAEERQFQEDEEAQNSYRVWTRTRSGVFVDATNTCAPPRLNKRIVDRGNVEDGRVPSRQASPVSKLPVASKQNKQGQPRKSPELLQSHLKDVWNTGLQSLGNGRLSFVDTARISKPQTEQTQRDVCSEHESPPDQSEENLHLRSMQMGSRLLGNKNRLSGDMAGYRQQQSAVKDICQTRFVVKSNINEFWNRACSNEGSEFKSFGIQTGKRQKSPQVCSEKVAIIAHKNTILTRPAFTEPKPEAVPHKSMMTGKRYNCIKHQQMTFSRTLSGDSKAQHDSNNPKSNDKEQLSSAYSVKSSQSKGFLLTAAVSAASASPTLSNSTPIVKGKIRSAVKHRLSGTIGKRTYRVPTLNSPIIRHQKHCGYGVAGTDCHRSRNDRNDFQFHEPGMKKHRTVPKTRIAQNSSPASVSLVIPNSGISAILDPQKGHPSHENPVPSSSGFNLSTYDILTSELNSSHGHGGDTYTWSSQDDIRASQKRRVGFTYLDQDHPGVGSRHRVGPRLRDQMSKHQASLRIKQPKEDSFVGKIVKMFEKRLQVLPSDDSNQETEHQ